MNRKKPLWSKRQKWPLKTLSQRSLCLKIHKAQKLEIMHEVGLDADWHNRYVVETKTVCPWHLDITILLKFQGIHHYYVREPNVSPNSLSIGEGTMVIMAAADPEIPNLYHPLCWPTIGDPASHKHHSHHFQCHKDRRFHWKGCKEVLDYAKPCNCEFRVHLTERLKSLRLENCRLVWKWNKALGLSSRLWCRNETSTRELHVHPLYQNEWVVRNVLETRFGAERCQILHCIGGFVWIRYAQINEMTFERNFLLSFRWFEDGSTAIHKESV